MTPDRYPLYILAWIEILRQTVEQRCRSIRVFLRAGMLDFLGDAPSEIPRPCRVFFVGSKRADIISAHWRGSRTGTSDVVVRLPGLVGIARPAVLIIARLLFARLHGHSPIRVRSPALDRRRSDVVKRRRR